MIDALPGSVITVENGYAIEAHKSRDDMHSLTTNINEKKRAVAYIYDPGVLKDLRALSESGYPVELHEMGTFVHDRGDVVLVSGGWVIENADTRRIRVEHGAVSLEDIAKELGGELA